MKSILYRCVVCRRLNVRPYSYPKTPNLPNIRLRDDTPFSGTGIDYLGPLFCKNVYTENSVEEDDMYKCFVALYTCASTRGVILELVHNGSSKTFINSLIRFIARRGCPKEILTDNGSVFTAADTQRFAAERKIHWKFNIAEAPWFGGFWERLVSTVKRCIKKTIVKAYLSYTELQTVLTEIELILNSRPLGALYDDDMEEILTPNHLLYGRKLCTTNSKGSVAINQIDISKRAKHLETIIEHF